MTQQKMTKESAGKILSTLDSTGNEVEDLMKQGIIAQDVGSEILRNMDSFADQLQIAVYGEDSFRAYQTKVSKVIKRDPDEKFMETFDNPQKPIKTDSDEPYMHHTDGGYNSKGMDTYDNDQSSGVSERDEYDVRDLSEWSDKTKKQPSWPGGSSGKSTKQGAAKTAGSTEKTWAP